jgi:hypothetical protein
MIPTIGIMIGGYIMLRCVEILFRNPTAFSSSTARTLVMACALLVGAVTAFEMFDLLLSSARSGVGSTATSTPAREAPPYTESPAELQRLREENQKLFDADKRKK